MCNGKWYDWNQALIKENAIIYDIMGRIVHQGRIESPIHVNNMGVYMVKVGNRQPQKEVVR